MTRKQTTDPRQYPIVVTEAEVDAHPHTAPALLPVPATLVHPLARMFRHSYDKNGTGILFRGLEALLVAIDENDPQGIDTAIQTVLRGWLVRKQEIPPTIQW